MISQRGGHTVGRNGAELGPVAGIVMDDISVVWLRGRKSALTALISLPAPYAAGKLIQSVSAVYDVIQAAHL